MQKETKKVLTLQAATYEKDSFGFCVLFVRKSAVFLKFRSFYFPQKLNRSQETGDVCLCCAVSLDKRREK